MGDIVIKAEQVSKKFVIGHQTGEKYTALRDVIASNTKSLWKKTKGLAGRADTSNTKSEEEFWALRDINFEIRQGDRVGIIGRNGAGKSTLLKVLSRITEPTGGRITINGRVASLLEVGTGFHPELSGRENIFLNGAILGMSRAEIREKFDEIVAFAEVERFLDTPVKRYSSGMYVRLAFAVAAHLEPEILIVDEVLAVGDAQFQKKCLGKMEDVSKNQGRTILFVSHHMQMINNLCDRSILLNAGQIVKEGPSAMITEVYLNQFRSNDSTKTWSPNEKMNRGVALRKMEVCDSRFINKDKYVLNEEVSIIVEFEVHEPVSGLCHSIAVINSDDAVAFVAISSNDELYKKSVGQGVYQTVCRIPGNLFNSGKYWIVSNIADEFHKVIVETDKEISFEMIDDGLDRAGYFGVWNGIFRPQLSWKTEKL